MDGILMGKLIDIAAVRKQDYFNRIRERELFEQRVIAGADALVKSRIEEFAGNSDERCSAAIFWNLVGKLDADRALGDELTQLAWRPISQESLERRLDALDIALQRYLPLAVREERPGAALNTYAGECD